MIAKSCKDLQFKRSLFPMIQTFQKLSHNDNPNANPHKKIIGHFKFYQQMYELIVQFSVCAMTNMVYMQYHTHTSQAFLQESYQADYHSVVVQPTLPQNHTKFPCKHNHHSQKICTYIPRNSRALTYRTVQPQRQTSSTFKETSNFISLHYYNLQTHYSHWCFIENPQKLYKTWTTAHREHDFSKFTMCIQPHRP